MLQQHLHEPQGHGVDRKRLDLDRLVSPAAQFGDQKLDAQLGVPQVSRTVGSEVPLEAQTLQRINQIDLPAPPVGIGQEKIDVLGLGGVRLHPEVPLV
jgi:hypothetical protein